MSKEEANEHSIFSSISRQNGNITPHILSKKNVIYEIIYKPNENIDWKKEELGKLQLDDDKEYSGDEFRIFGKKFVERNKYTCKIIYNNKQYELKEYFKEIDNNYKDKNIIKLKLIEIVDIIDMSEMFYGCYHLISFSEYLEENYYQQINYSKDILSESNYSSSLSEEDKLNTFYNNNIIQLSFYNYTKIDNDNNFEKNSIITIYFPKSSLKKVNTKNMEGMFYGCLSLISLPDISKWNTSKVTDLSHMFFGCNSLTL